MTDTQLAANRRLARDKALDLGPQGSTKRAAMTTKGAIEVEVLDRFTEVILDRHHEAVRRFLVSGDDHDLREFEGIRVDELSLVASRQEFHHAWLGWF